MTYECVLLFRVFGSRNEGGRFLKRRVVFWLQLVSIYDWDFPFALVELQMERVGLFLGILKSLLD